MIHYHTSGVIWGEFFFIHATGDIYCSLYSKWSFIENNIFMNLRSHAKAGFQKKVTQVNELSLFVVFILWSSLNADAILHDFDAMHSKCDRLTCLETVV